MKRDLVFRGRSPERVREVTVVRIDGLEEEQSEDSVAVEEPLEIRLGFHKRGKYRRQPISITMRTPGDDFDLAVGFLFSESIVNDSDDIDEIAYCGAGDDEEADDEENTNVVRVDLAENVEVEMLRLQRHFYTTSSCGVCGKTSLEALDNVGCQPLGVDAGSVSAALVHRLPEILRERQQIFASTGGLHAAGLFSGAGELLTLREDVGRHNAVDKVVGHHLRNHELPVAGTILMLSGRASFELLQKALVARIPVVASVGAPSSLAVQLAERFGVTLMGFVRGERFNVYTHAERLVVD